MTDVTVWAVEWRDGDEHPEDCEPYYALFDTREAAMASCPPHGEVREVPVRSGPLATQTRWSGWVWVGRKDGQSWTIAKVSGPTSYTVNEFQYEFGKPLTPFGDLLRSCHAPSREEALAYLHNVADPINESAKEPARLARRIAELDAKFNQDYSCPDHGVIGRARPGAVIACEPCRRWVDEHGNRFGHYGKMPDGQLSYSTYPSNGYDEGPL